MTTFRLDATAGAGTHVFLIGVGHYPHLKNGGGKQVKGQAQLGQLTSPPNTAHELLKWFDTELNNPEAPLKSVEVLISGAVPLVFEDADGLTQEVEGVTLNKVKVAAEAWFDRLDTDENNIGVFYFCGHGLGDGYTTQLLLSDYGKSAIALENAIHFNGFKLAMGTCRAKRQIYFVDACRSVDATMLTDPNQKGSALLPSDVLKVFDGAAPAFFAAKQGEQAYGHPNGLSRFGMALLDSLRKFGVSRHKGKKWKVSPQTLQVAMAAILQDPASDRPECTTEGIVGTGSNFTLHELQGKPQVMLDVFLSVAEASDAAAITCSYNGKVSARPNGDHPWRAIVDEGNCDISAQFPVGSIYVSTQIAESVFPPHQQIELEVQ